MLETCSREVYTPLEARGQRPISWFQKKDWQKEIKRMLSSGLKYELDALANKDFQFLTKTYLASSRKRTGWTRLGARSGALTALST
jgi:hypothetical protein